MKIIINATPLIGTKTGVGNYLYQTCDTLKKIDAVNDYSYYYGYYFSQKFPLKSKRYSTLYELKQFAKKIPLTSRGMRQLRQLSLKLQSRKFDLYFEPNFIPLNLKSKYIVTTICDFSFYLYPDWHPRERVNYFEREFCKNIKRSDKIIVISNFIKQSAIDIFGLPENKLRTIYLGVNKTLFKKYNPTELNEVKLKYDLPGNFMLFVGSIEPRKNLNNFLEAYLRLDDRLKKEYKLILVGFKGWENTETMQLLKKLKSNVKYLGYVSEEDLAKIYNLASLFVYPSLYEGFGLPPLEAMACGTPVLVSNAASLPEVCGDAAYYVNPNDLDDMAEGISKILTDEFLRKELITKGDDRSSLYTWEKTAREHLNVFEEASKD